MIEYLFVLAGLLAAARTVLGPSFADRMISGGALTSVVVMLISLQAVKTGSDFYLDIAIIVSLLSFTGTLAVARFIGGLHGS